jgi:hypothetical protein
MQRRVDVVAHFNRRYTPAQRDLMIDRLLRMKCLLGAITKDAFLRMKSPNLLDSDSIPDGLDPKRDRHIPEWARITVADTREGACWIVAHLLAFSEVVRIYGKDNSVANKLRSYLTQGMEIS